MNYPKKASKTTDIVDHWLESHGYYRKHTARDSTCLFRVISEQIFLTQKYHDRVRADCVKFMRENIWLFEKDIMGSPEAYLNAMSGLGEFGGPLEIAAMSKLYRRDVYIFEKTAEPENVTNGGYTDKILMFHIDGHYDSVFDKTYIQDAAFCQSLVYNILYKSVFKLPDVQYAVTQMLHEPLTSDHKLHANYLLQSTHVLEKRKKYAGRNQEWCILEEADPENTSCILEDVRKCMFHNLDENKNASFHYEALEYNNGNDIEMNDGSDKINKRNMIKLTRNKTFFFKNASETVGGHCYVNNAIGVDMADANNNRDENNFAAMIPEFVARILNLTDFYATDPNVSCVKQMLKENLTPFPYKVAKALDPEIYRNIEFDTWNEMRRELRYGNWYNGGTNLQVGVKCLVKLSEGQLTWYHCHIQDMPPGGEPCVVFVEELGEKKTVPRDFLQPLPSGQAKPWALPYRHYRNLASTIQNSKLLALADYEKLKKASMFRSRKIKDLNIAKSDIGCSCSESRDGSEHFDSRSTFSDNNINDIGFENYNKFHGLTSYRCTENNVDIVAMPVSIMLDHSNASSNVNHIVQNNSSVMSNESCVPSVDYNNDANSSNMNNQSYTHSFNPYPWPNNNTMNNQGNAGLSYANHIAPNAGSNSGQPNSMHIQDNQTNTNHVQFPGGTENIGSVFSQSYIPISPQRHAREINQTQFGVNYCATKSFLPSGADLPLNDTTTLRFFYNLGIDYFNMPHVRNQYRGLRAERQLSDIFNRENIGSSSLNSGFFDNQEEICLDFHNNFIYEIPNNEEITINAFGENQQGASRSSNSNMPTAQSNTCEAVPDAQINSPHVAFNLANHTSQNNNIGAATPNIDLQRPIQRSPYMMTYTQVPGMYSTMVPCYPIDDGNLYIAQYMGIPFGVVPPNIDISAAEHALEQPSLNGPTYSVPSSPAPYQSPTQPHAGPGFYRNQVWYPAPPQTPVQPVAIPQRPPYNQLRTHQTSSNENNNQ